MAEWVNWREARKAGKPVGAIWKKDGPRSRHLQNEVQMLDDEKVSAVAGNQYGSVWVQAYEDRVEVIYYGADDKEYRREVVARAPNAPIYTEPPLDSAIV